MDSQHQQQQHQKQSPYGSLMAEKATPSSTHLLSTSPTEKYHADVQAMFARPPSLRSIASKSSLNDTPYSAARASKTGSIASSISDQFSLPADPLSWGTNLSMRDVEPDDYLHNPDPRRDRKFDRGGTIFTARGFANLGCIIVLAVGMTTLFAGYPLISYFTTHKLTTLGGFNIGGINATGQIPNITAQLGMIDPDTPQEAYIVQSYEDGSDMQLVFSDEFNVDGRTFYPGDDPYWEAVNLHYWQTGNLEWYDPIAVKTSNGSLQITLSATPKNGLNYTGGMLSTWNKFCFTGGRVEVGVSLPGSPSVPGFWPAVWTMGNLGRAGYGASLDGMWPYTYDSCDVGTLANQTQDGLPYTATENGDPQYNGELSYLPGQRLSACTCPNSSHPGPIVADSSVAGGQRYKGRAAPEIDIFEAQVTVDNSPDGTTLSGQVSQSGQFAPMDEAYQWLNASSNWNITNPDLTQFNPYLGGVYQQAVSGVTETDQSCYELTEDCFSVYGVEYKPGFQEDGAYITWIASDQPVWTLYAAGVGTDSNVEIGPRAISYEPMYILANLGISPQFSTISEDLIFPATLKIDYVRVYQSAGQEPNYSCDPSDYPTADYINQYMEAYINPNLTTWVDDYGQTIPRNSFLETC